MANVIGQTHRAATHLMAATANCTEALEILSTVAVLAANIQVLEMEMDLEEKQLALESKYPKLAKRKSEAAAAAKK